MKVMEVLTEEQAGIVIEAAMLRVGKDILLVVSGGELPHIGALSFGDGRERQDVALGTHKELAVTALLYERLRCIHDGSLLVTGGIHIDHITSEQIALVLRLCENLAERAAERLTYGKEQGIFE